MCQWSIAWHWCKTTKMLVGDEYEVNKKNHVAITILVYVNIKGTDL